MDPKNQGLENELVIKMRHIEKRFPGVLANDNVDFNLIKGEIHALLGENGAGKSTLMNILAGLYKADKGSIFVEGKRVSFNSPKDAIAAGIGMVHQHFMLVPSQTVTENILLGLNEPRFIMNLSDYDKKIVELGEKFGLPVDPKAKIWQLSVGEQQRVEILKMLYRGANVLILDEPTAVLAPVEIDILFNTLRNMVSLGKSVIFISHKLHEVQSIADRLTVLRKGKITAEGVEAAGKSRADLAKLMVGRDVIFNFEKEAHNPGKTILEVKDLHCFNDKGLKALNGVSLEVCSGEIVGLAGVAGNGQRELADALTGLRKCEQGSVVIHGDETTNKSAKTSIKKGVSHIPEDRTHVGTAPNLSVTDNVIMKSYNNKPISNGWVLNTVEAEKNARELKEAYEIVVPSIDTPVRLLSGGNLQRVILAREISAAPSLMIAMQPTRGLDVGAIEGVQRLILAQKKTGAGILLISEELEELIALSDRIYVMYEGEIMGQVTNGDIDAIGLMMTGTRMEEIQEAGVTHE
ncbi:MAG: heme ABC transporter ATP-binding protein [Anaerolineaceae bacterium]|nr:heme ABC transporter ATP-binding protein [Anaerolineaceae bacterium]